MDKEERRRWANASPVVKREGIKLLTIDMFVFQHLDYWHPQADDLHFIVRDIRYDDFIRKLNTI